MSQDSDDRAPHADPGRDLEPVPLPLDGVLDLHTFRPQDAGAVTSDYLDECCRQGVRRVRIVHGKGIGNLRRTVEAVLRRHPAVAGFRTAPEGLGGWGAMLVDLQPCAGTGSAPADPPPPQKLG
jgi:DNA-nicking Smr family endonuclease